MDEVRFPYTNIPVIILKRTVRNTLLEPFEHLHGLVRTPVLNHVAVGPLL